MIIIMSIKIRALALILLIKRIEKKNPNTQGEVKSDEVTRFTD